MPNFTPMHRFAEVDSDETFYLCHDCIGDAVVAYVTIRDTTVHCEWLESAGRDRNYGYDETCAACLYSPAVEALDAEYVD